MNNEQQQKEHSYCTRQIIGLSLIGAMATVVIASIAVPLLLASQYSSPNGSYYYRPPPFFFFAPFHFGGLLGDILLIFLILWVARSLVWPRRRGYQYNCSQQPRTDAVSIVKERYAKGEITKEQFEQMLRDLRQE
ncbi:MAG TPA: SHOCT domain-containing protein [Nitrososphaera sp.]|nr:SHOCT domain-containing protein [Nitrososphaera sp.]